MVSDEVLRGIEKERNENTHQKTKYGLPQQTGINRRAPSDPDVGFMADMLDVEGEVFGDDWWWCCEGGRSIGSAGGFGRWRGTDSTNGKVTAFLAS